MAPRRPAGRRHAETRKSDTVLCLLVLGLLAALPGCRRFTKAGADREVYGILDAKGCVVPDLAGGLEIDARTRPAEALREERSHTLTLKDTLALATVASRDYRQQRENVYLSALALTRAINEFRPIFGAGGGADLQFDEGGTLLDSQMDATFSRALANGGSVVIGLASNFLHNITGDPLRVAQSIIDANVILPLMRGSGELVAQENLRQAERDTSYALRDYALFQQDFTVDIASRFYRALQLRDVWNNAEASYESLERLMEEQAAKASSGRIPRFEVDQTEQRLLEEDDRRVRAHNAFDAAVDRIKLDIGIPVGTDVVLADSDLERLRTLGPQEAPYPMAEALELADERRLDLRNRRDQEVDAVRHVEVARDGLRGELNLRFGGELRTDPEQPFNLRTAGPSGSMGLDFDLPLERTAERNVYRRTLIDVDRARRARELLEDTVVFDVRDAYRTLAGTARSYRIQVESAALNERRVESTNILLMQGRASTRDRLEAEDDRRQSRNAVTAALVDQMLAHLALRRDVGILRVTAEGMWMPSATQPVSAARADAALPAPTAPTAASARRPLSAPLAPGPQPRPTGAGSGRAAAQGSLPPPDIANPPSSASSPTSGRPPTTRAAPVPKASPMPARTDGRTVLPPPSLSPKRSGTVGE